MKSFDLQPPSQLRGEMLLLRKSGTARVQVAAVCDDAGAGRCSPETPNQHVSLGV